ncbi:MAG: guanylate kinase [Bacillota bacterium]
MEVKGKLFVISGPSGVGKGTVLDVLMQENNLNLNYSISATTRDPRPGEIDGEDYYFISEKEFFHKKKNDKFIETAKVHNNYYGTPRKNVENNLKKGNNIILEIDIQGARQIRTQFPEAVLIFLEPPSFSELKNRLNKRGTENNKIKNIRLKNARNEMEAKSIFDYSIVNDDIKKSAKKLKQIILKEISNKEE